MRKLLFASLAAALPLIAADPRLGAWKLVSANSTLDPPRKFTVTAEGNGIHFQNSPSTQEFFGQYDGKIYPLLKGPGNQVAIRKTGRDKIEFVYRKDGAVTATYRVAFSIDWNELVETYTSVLPPEPEVTLVWDRTGEERSTIDPFIGEWTQNGNKSRLRQKLVLKIETNGDGVRFTGDFSYTAKPDGTDYPVKDFRDDAVALQFPDAYTVTSIYKRAGKVADEDRWVVSRDGKQMTMTVTGTLANGARISEELVFERE